MTVRVSVDSWHYRLLGWTYGEVPRNLCPYVDKLVLAMIASPVTVVYKAVTFRFKFIVIIESLAFAWSALGVFWLGWWAPVFIHIVLYGTFGLVISGIRIAEYIDNAVSHPHMTKKEKPPQPKRPGIVREWLKAKHARVCPSMEFEDFGGAEA